MKSNTIVKKFGEFRIVADKGEDSQHLVRVFHGDNEVMSATMICCAKHLDSFLVEFAKKYFKVAIARFKKDRKELKKLLESTEAAFEEAKL